ncbi:uncharacterized protein FFNC_10319 [Fusarium fujikuroi]|nr:uncharacterized protein FFNC_10319 [Fusarium fujikuroi]
MRAGYLDFQKTYLILQIPIDAPHMPYHSHGKANNAYPSSTTQIATRATFLCEFYVLKCEKDAPRLSHKVMSTWLDVRQYERARLIEINSYVKKDMGRAFGIGYNFGWDKHGHPTLSDWTYIPSIVVAEWRSKFEPDVTFYEILNTDVERMERCS